MKDLLNSLGRMVEDAIDATMIIDGHGRIQYVNQALVHLTGYGKGELEGQSMNGLLPENVAAHHDGYLVRYLASDVPSTVLGRVREMAIRHRTGEIIPVELKAIDLGFEHGERLFGGSMVDLRERKRIEAQNEALRATLQQLALSDELTGLPNRRAFINEASREIAQALRDRTPIVVGIADLDHFKHVNDTFGHTAGDAVLRTVSDALQSILRRGDLVGRIGGEELGILLPGTPIEEAAAITERMRHTVETARTPLNDGQEVRVSISIGMTALRASDTPDAMLVRADAALYRAKHEGRNRVAQI